MGAKYIPSIRDQKAAQRWQKRDNPNLPGFKKTPSVSRGMPKSAKSAPAAGADTTANEPKD